MEAIVYAPGYNIGLLGLERLHPFDSRKYGRAMKRLRRSHGDTLRRMLIRPKRPSDATELGRVHTHEYLTSLRTSDAIASVLELPWARLLPRALLDRGVLRAMRLATRGTVLAARAALERGSGVINMGGGFHHAGPDRGEGFCVYSDVAVAVHAAVDAGLMTTRDRFVHIDLDAHQGNGVSRVFMDNPAARLFDMYNAAIYPGDGPAIARLDADVPLAPGCPTAEYTARLRAELPAFLERAGADGPVRLAFYNAGTDIYRDDPLGGLGVDADGIRARDRFVLETLDAAGIPWVMVTSGGYTRESHRFIADAVADAIDGSRPP